MSDPGRDRWAGRVEERSRGNVWGGIGLTVLLHFFQVPLIMIVSSIPDIDYAALYPLVFLGLSQWIYLLPAILLARRKGYSETAKGLIIGGAITFLLNAACTGLLFFAG